MRLFHALLGLVIALSGCAGISADGPVVPRNLARGALSGVTEAKEEVIKTQAAWEKWWAKHSVQAPAAAPPPKVDFKREMVLAVTMGRRRTGGYSLEILGAETRGQRLRVTVRRQAPPPGAMVTQALTAPFHVVAVPRSDLKVEFIEAGSSEK